MRYQSEDEVLVGSILDGGDPDEHWRRLWERHGHACYRIAMKVLHREGDAWSVVNDAWATAAERLSERVTSFAGWIAKITRNRALDFLRDEQRRIAREHSFRPWHHSALLSAQDPAIKAVVVEAVGAVAHCEKLTVNEREDFLLRSLGGLSYEEIARITGRAIGTISANIHRAKEKLKSLPRIRRLLLPLALWVLSMIGAGRLQ